ncbi:MAG: DUF4440 domain-containing protein [Pseudomonadota bacterium]
MSAQTTAAILRDLEERLLRPEVREDAQAAGELIASDFVEIGKSGKVYDRRQILNSMASEPLTAALTIENFETRELAPAVVLVTYRCQCTLRSSIWRQSGDRWQIVFHQGTPGPEASE